MKIKSKLTAPGLVPIDSIGFVDVFVFGAVMHIEQNKRRITKK
jgi:hypothetical protein